MNKASFNVRLVTKSGEQFRLQNVICISLTEPDNPILNSYPYGKNYVFISDSHTRIERSVSDIKSLEIEYIKPEKEHKKNDEE